MINCKVLNKCSEYVVLCDKCERNKCNNKKEKLLEDCFLSKNKNVSEE